MEVLLFMVGTYPPPDRILGVVQKIFYIHVSSAFAMLLALSCGSVFSLVDLVKQNDKSDAIARACIEVGVLFGAVVLTTGPLWGRKSWGAYWTWEPRLTLTLLTELLAISVIAVRDLAPTSDVGRRAGSAMAVMAAPAAYLIHVAVRLWGGNHPQVIQGGGGGIQSAEMRHTFIVGVIAVLLFAGSLVAIRYRGLRLAQTAADLRLRLSAHAIRAGRATAGVIAVVFALSIASPDAVAAPSSAGEAAAAMDENPAKSTAASADKPADAKAAPAKPRDLSKYKEESVPGGLLLWLAYLVVWALMFFFVFRMIRSQTRAAAEIRDLSERLEVIEEDSAAKSQA